MRKRIGVVQSLTEGKRRGHTKRVPKANSLNQDASERTHFFIQFYYVNSSAKPSHSSSSSSPDSSSSRPRFPPLLSICSSRCSTSSSARVTQVNRLPFESYSTTGDISTVSTFSLKLGGGRSDRS